MGNKAYLCSTNYEGTYPSHELASYDPAIHTIASGAQTVPLVWLALFGADSLVRHTFQVPAEDCMEFGPDGKGKRVTIPAHEVEALAPVAETELCLDRFPQNVRRLEEMLRIPSGTLAEHQACLVEAIEEHSGEFLTIEWAEIICMSFEEEEGYSALRSILRWFDGQGDREGITSWLKTLDLDTSRPILSPRGFYKRDDLEDHDYRNLENLIGSGYCGTAPWER